jgi:zinc protease
MKHRSTLAAFLLIPLLAACATTTAHPAQENQPSPNPALAALLAEPLPSDSQVVIGTLENGLRYYIRVNNEPKARAELRLVVNAGSVLEDEDQRGLAHFVEHMAFNGTRNFEKHELVDYLESIGMRFGPDINAYTSFDETVYMLTVPTDSAGMVDRAFDILEDWAHGITFDSLEVEKERGVVIEEWRLGQGAGARMRDIQFPVLFRGSRYAERLPIGQKATLESFDHEVLKRYYRDWYRPDLMAVVAVGDFDPARIERLIRDHFGDIPPAAQPRERTEFDVPDHEQTLFSVATDPEATGSSVSIYQKTEPGDWATASDFRRWLVESLASSMLNNRLSEMTQKPDAPFLNVSSFHGRFLRPLSAFVLSASVKDSGIEQGLDALVTEAERVAQHGFTESELEREKAETLRMLERQAVEQAKSHSAGFAAEYVSHYLYGGALMQAEEQHALGQRLIPGITVDEVNRVADQWEDRRNRVILANAPAKEGVPVPSEAALAAVVDSVAGRTFAAYADAVSDAPLVSHVPEGGRVVEERTIPEIDVHEWTLSNGVRVILKPTDFRNDEVLLAGRSPGGTSLVSDQDYVAGLTATAAVQVGGVGELSIIELQKRLAGKAVSVGTNIGELQETVSGGASPKDLEALFQLVYLKFTAPRVDSAAFLAYKQQAQSALENRGASPEAHFSDTLQVTLAQGHPRARPPSSELFDKLDLGRSFEIYRERFADASDFTFYLVGSFDPDSVRPLVETYLGGLPSLHRDEKWKDIGITPPGGVIKKTVRKGVEPKARTQIVFTGPLEFGRQNLYALNSLATVLEIRLREVLREDMGGTYGVSVSATSGRDPNPEYRFSIGFGAAPERLDELVKVVFAQIDSLKSGGAAEKDLVKVRETQRRSRETRLRENGFWISQLITYDRYGWDPRQIALDEARIERATPELIRRAARQYLNTDRYVQVSLVPEGQAEPAGSR